MHIREADPSDNNALLALTRACPMQGYIELIIDRSPDFFSLLKSKGTGTTLVAELEDRLVGCISLVSEKLRIGRDMKMVAYICDLKIHPDYRGSSVSYRLIRAIDSCRDMLGLDICLIITAAGNTKVQDLLQGRLGIQKAFKVADVTAFQYLPGKYNPPPFVQPYDRSMKNNVGALLQEHCERFQFTAPADTYIQSLSPDNCWVIREDNEITGCIGIIDTSAMKQNIVTRIPPRYKFLLRLAGFLKPRLKIPKEGQPILILDIRFLVCRNPGKAGFLINRIRDYALKNNYSLISYAVDNRDPLFSALNSLTYILFNSCVFVMEFGNASGMVNPETPCHYDFYNV